MRAMPGGKVLSNHPQHSGEMLRPSDALPRIDTPLCSSPGDPEIAGASPSPEMVHASIPLDDPTATSRQHNALLPLVTISSGPNAVRARQAEVLLMHCLCIAYAPLFCTRHTLK